MPVEGAVHSVEKAVIDVRLRIVFAPSSGHGTPRALNVLMVSKHNDLPAHEIPSALID